MTTTAVRAGSADSASGDGRRARILVGVVVVVVWGLITHGTFAGSGDEPHYMMIAHSLAFDADVDLTNDYRDATLIGGGTLQPEAHAIARSGRLRPVHDIGMPLAFAPVVRVAYTVAERLGAALPAAALEKARLTPALLLRHQISLVMALLTGLLARELFLTIRGLGATARTAFAWAVLGALTPPILSHAFLFFTEIPTALVALFVFRRLTLQPVRTPGMAGLLGALAGALLLVHARNIGIVAGLTLLALLTARRRALSPRFMLVFLGGVTIAVLARTVTTYWMWGSILTTPHAALAAPSSWTDVVAVMCARGAGLLFDREYGLLAYGPVYLLAGPGYLFLRANQPQLARDLGVVLGCYLLPVLLPLTNVHGWTGGWSPAARFLVPIAPLLWVGVYAYGSHAAGAGRLVVALLVGLQLAINAIAWQFPKTLWNDGDGVSALRWTQWLPTWSGSVAVAPFAFAFVASVIFAYLMYRFTVRTPAARMPTQ